MSYKIEYNDKGGHRQVITTDNITKFYQELDGKTIISVKKLS